MVVVVGGGVGVGAGVGMGTTPVAPPLPDTGFDDVDEGPVPYLFVALTVKEYLFEFFGSENAQVLFDVSHVNPAGRDEAL